jgi:hypothetical protein
MSHLYLIDDQEGKHTVEIIARKIVHETVLRTSISSEVQSDGNLYALARERHFGIALFDIPKTEKFRIMSVRVLKPPGLM